MVDEETGGGTVVEDEVVEDEVDDDEVDDAAGASVVDGGGAVVTGRLVVDAGRVVVERAVAGGAVGSGAREVVGPTDSSTVVVLVEITAPVSAGSAVGSLVGRRRGVVEGGGPAGEVGTSTAAVVTSNIVGTIRVTSGERTGHHRRIATSTIAARVTAIRAFSTGRAIRTSLGNESTSAFLDEAMDIPVRTECYATSKNLILVKNMSYPEHC